MSDAVKTTWYARHASKVELFLLVFTFLLVCNSAAEVLGFGFLEPFRPRSSLMLALAMFMNAALSFWRVQSRPIMFAMITISAGLLIGSVLIDS